MRTDGSGLDVTIADERGGMVLRWTLVAEVIDDDGTESLRIATSGGMATWTRLGLLDYAASLIRADLAAAVIEEGDQ